MTTILLSELKNKLGNFNKTYLADGSILQAANVVQASGKTVELPIDEVSNYFDTLCEKTDTAVVLGVAEFEEYDIVTLSSRELNREKRVIARAQDYFAYANHDSVSLILLDHDSGASIETHNQFLRDLDEVLSPCLIGETDQQRKSICRWTRPSTSGAVKGSTKNGQHTFLAVRNAHPDIVSLIHKWCWLHPIYGKGYKINKAGNVMDESLVDSATGGPERVVYTSDPTLLNDDELIVRRCAYHPGGILDSELVVHLLREKTKGFANEWRSRKKFLDNLPEVKSKKAEHVAKLASKKVADGYSPKEAKRIVSGYQQQVVYSNDTLLKNSGESIQVVDILTDRDSYINVGHFCDPVERELDRNVGMIMGDDNQVFLHSFEDGGIKYILKWTYEDLNTWVSSCDQDELEDWFSLHIPNSNCSNIQTEKLNGIVSKRLDVSIAAVRKDVKSYKAPQAFDDGVSSDLDVKSTHADIIHDYLNNAGDCRGFGNGVYTWNEGNTIWVKRDVQALSEQIMDRYNHVSTCQRIPEYKALSIGIAANTKINVTTWESAYGFPASDAFYMVTSDGVTKENYSKQLGCRYKLQYKPEPIPTPYFDMLLKNVINPIALQRLFGLSLCGYLLEMQKAVVLKGPGGTGKGTLSNILKAMLPSDRVTNVSLAGMDLEKHRIALVDSVINIIPETDCSGPPLSLNGFKMITGDDTVSAWVLYKGMIFFKPTCVNWLSINDWPPLATAGPEIERRVGNTIIEFVRRNDSQIDGLAKMIISQELPGILYWAIQGVKDYFHTDEEYGGLYNEHSSALFQLWTRSFDPIKTFFDERVNLPDSKDTAGFFVKRSTLYKEYKLFCENSGLRVMGRNKFYTTIQEKYNMKGASLLEGEFYYKELRLK